MYECTDAEQLLCANIDDMDFNLDQPIAYGRTAEIYAWPDDQVLKLFYDWFELESIRYELRIAQAVHSSGLPVPSVGEIIRINDRNGLTYQRMDGVPMWEIMSRKPWTIYYYARRMAELHVEMHASDIQADIPTQRQRLIDKICDAEALPADLRSKALSVLESMPDGSRLCHGDFHPLNIMVSGQGEIIIDWIDASLGNPLADLARTTIILLGAVETNQVQNLFEKAIVRVFHNKYIRHYFSLRPSGEHEYSCWLPIIAAARLSEEIPELEAWLIAQTGKAL
jgi:uncharacterized protein (TIGR02172 family)